VTVAEFPLSGMTPPDEPGGLDRGSDRNPDRTPPQDLAAEQGVLGGMLLSKDAIADVVEVVRGADFYKPAHQTIYDTILDLYGRGEPADALTVAADLTRQGEIARIGGPAYLHTLISMVPTAANAGYYAEIVRERAILRRLVEAGTRIVQLGYSADGAEVDAVVDRAQAEVYAVTERRTSEDYIALGDVMPGTLDEIEAISNRSGELVGVPTGFGDLDGLLHGLHPGQMIVVAARPATGKCLAAGTLITEARTGERLTIAEFVRRGQAGEDLRVHTLGGDWRLSPVAPSDFIDNGVRDVLTVRLRSGRRLTATPNHPLLTVDGWAPIETLAAGSRVAVPRRPQINAGSKPYDMAAAADTIPGQVWDRILKAKGERSWAEVNREAGLPATHNWHGAQRQDLGRSRLAALADALGDDDLYALAASDVFWDEIVAIEPAGRQQVFDLTIDGTHNFVADDVIVHNSTLGLDFARSASIKHGLTSAVFSLEMSRNEITMRLLSAEAKVALHHMRAGTMGDDDWTRLARTMGRVSSAPLFIDDSPNMSMMEIRAKCRRLKQRHDLKLVIVDYLQLMTSGKRVESRQQEVSEFSRSLKLLAKELEVPVVAISQLNRGPEQRTDKKPMMSDLRESGAIEQDADIVMLLHREDQYERESPRAGEADIIVAKHRNGPTSTVTVAFQGHYSRFVDMAQG
jgi:replicative DNA helicase